MKRFQIGVPVEFRYCDPAGMIFYPRYFELLNHVVENWFAVLGCDYHELHIVRREGIPVVRIEADFTAPTRLGDHLDFSLRLLRLGRRSFTVRIVGRCAGERRLEARMVLVYSRATDTETASVDIPPALRERMHPYLDPSAQAS